MKIFLTFILFLSIFNGNAQLTKKQILSNINKWYVEHPEKYLLDINGKDAIASITNYHPERETERNDLIVIKYRGMEMELKFSKPIDEISTQSDSLNNYFSYISLNKIYHEIPMKGWRIYPRTALSSLRGGGVVFSQEGDSLNLSLNWSIFGVFGYRDTKECDKELSIEDGSVSEICFVSVRKDLPLIISITNLQIK
jgi:hypothetical protein